VERDQSNVATTRTQPAARTERSEPEEEAEQRELPQTSTMKRASTPDFLQTDPAADFSGNGSQYCGPVATSNGLSWLASHGYPNLAASGSSAKRRQIAMIKTLARLMDTSDENGTGTTGLMRGISRYISEAGYQLSRLEYKGWRRHDSNYGQGSIADMDWLKEGIAGENSSVCLNIGWYERRADGKYWRIGGHWVTAVGYGVRRGGARQANTILVHDPSPRAGSRPSTQYLLLREMSRGRLEGRKAGLPVDAAGYLEVQNGLSMKENADVAIIDGAVLFELRQP